MNNGMNIRQCYTVLELPMRAPLEEVKLSYKDLVQVWHPDRFTHSPRLQEKAADKLQQLNEAYDTLKTHLERQSVQGAYSYGTASYGSTAYGAASQAAAASSTATAQAASTSKSSRSRSQNTSKARGSAPSFFDSGETYSWQWQLKAAGVIFGLLGVLMVPVFLAMVLARFPQLAVALLLLPSAAYLYRIWVMR